MLFDVPRESCALHPISGHTNCLAPPPRPLTREERARARTNRRALKEYGSQAEKIAAESLKQYDEIARRDPIYDSLYPRPADTDDLQP